MFSWVLTFLVVALIAGVLGFGGIAGASVEIGEKNPFFQLLRLPEQRRDRLRYLAAKVLIDVERQRVRNLFELETKGKQGIVVPAEGGKILCIEW